MWSVRPMGLGKVTQRAAVLSRAWPRLPGPLPAEAAGGGSKAGSPPRLLSASGRGDGGAPRRAPDLRNSQSHGETHAHVAQCLF